MRVVFMEKIDKQIEEEYNQGATHMNILPDRCIFIVKNVPIMADKKMCRSMEVCVFCAASAALFCGSGSEKYPERGIRDGKCR